MALIEREYYQLQDQWGHVLGDASYPNAQQAEEDIDDQASFEDEVYIVKICSTPVKVFRTTREVVSEDLG